MEETGVPWKNHWPVKCHWQTLPHIVVSSIPCHELGSNSQLMGNDIILLISEQGCQTTLKLIYNLISGLRILYICTLKNLIFPVLGQMMS